MQYSLAALLAVAGVAVAQTAGFNPITAPLRDQEFDAGSTMTIEWTVSPEELASEKLDIVLLAGSSNITLSAAGTIASDIPNSGSFDWDIPSDLGDDATYGFKMQLASDPETFQFSFPFIIKASDGGSSKTTSGSGNSTTTAKPTKTNTSTDSEETGDSTDSSMTTKAKTTVTSVVTGPTGGATTSPTAVTGSTGAAPHATAGAIAALGGFAMAVLAL